MRVKDQTIEEMTLCGATNKEAETARDLFAILRPGLRVKRNGRVDTGGGDKSALGLLRTIKAVMESHGYKVEE